jgi:hypothetical protein
MCDHVTAYIRWKRFHKNSRLRGYAVTRASQPSNTPQNVTAHTVTAGHTDDRRRPTTTSPRLKSDFPLDVDLLARFTICERKSTERRRNTSERGR